VKNPTKASLFVLLPSFSLMASLFEISSEHPDTATKKRALNEEEGSSDFSNKKPKLRVWENLDLILSLQSKDTSLERLILLSIY
jgi:hypothetical protein